MTLLIILTFVELWIILGLISLPLFSYLNDQKVRVDDLSVIFLFFLFGPFTYEIIEKLNKEQE